MDTNTINSRVAEANAQASSGQVGGALTKDGIISQDGINPIKPVSSVVDATRLGQDNSLSIPQTNPSTLASGISGMTSAMVEQAKLQREQDQKAEVAKTEADDSKNALAKVYERIMGVQSSRTSEEEKAKIADKTQKVTEYTNQLEGLDRAEVNELRALENIGLTPIQKQQKQQEISRRYAFQKADVGLLQSAANRDLATAQSIVDRKIQLQLEPLQTQLDMTKTFYQDNKERFTKAEDRAFNTKIQQLNQQFETEKANKTAIANLQLKALENGVDLSPVVIKQLDGAKDAQEATAILARNGISLQNPLDVQSKRMDIAYKQAQIDELNRKSAPAAIPSVMVPKTDEKGNVVKDAQGNVEMVDATEDPFVQKLLKTAGGKALTDTSIQKIDKGRVVLSQLGVLQSNIEGLKTGPIVGSFRGKNPWDTNAQVIKKQLNAIVPNLARGVYGEVGVLTDNDIKTYAGTIPNLSSKEEVRNAVLYITLDMIGKSIKTTLDTNASAKRDVSGFVDVYTEIEAAKNSILSSIPDSQVPKAFQGKEGKQIDLSGINFKLN